MMGTTIIITMGMVSVVSALTEKILEKTGRERIAKKVNKIGTGIVSIIALSCAVKVFIEITKL